MAAPLAPSTPQTAYVLCADCGTPIEPNSANLCINCLKNSVDITSQIPKQTTISFCKGCSRYLSPPTTWLIAELESRELLAICLRKLKTLKTVRLIDASFLWTEPHSKRLRVKLTVQKEVLTGTIIQQVFEVEYIVVYGQCPDCTKLAAKNTWRANIQVRQKVDHKRTFLYLEQLILKHGADRDTIGVKEAKDGLDFFYASKQHAAKMVEFLGAVTPVRSKSSEQLISIDVHSSSTNSKTTFSVEIAPICKDDLICLPRSTAKSLSNIGQLCLCYRVNNSISLMDPTTLEWAEVSSQAFWRQPFSSLVSNNQTIEFVVLDVEATQHPPKTAYNGKWVLADAQVSPVNGTMDDDAIIHTRTHLGGVLKPGDTVAGYMLRSTNFNNEAWDSLNQDRTPEVILVKKTYPNRKKKSKGRNWKLKTMAKEAGDDHIGLGRNRMPTKSGKMDADKAEADYEAFLQELEEDEELRAGVQLWRANPQQQQQKKNEDSMDIEGASHQPEGDADMEDDGDDDDDEIPKIQMDELLDDFDDLEIGDDE